MSEDDRCVVGPLRLNAMPRDGAWMPTFPTARYISGRLEAEAGPGIMPPRNADASEDSVAPILAAGMAELVEAPHVIAPGVTLLPAPGHSPGMMVVEVCDGAGGVVLAGADPMHHPLPLFAPELNTRRCQNPDQAATTRLGLLDRGADEGFRVRRHSFLHDPCPARAAFVSSARWGGSSSRRP